MYANVLLPIDLNHQESWERALPAALRLLEGDGTLHLLAVVPDFGMSMVANYFPKGFERKALDHVADDLRAFAAREVPTGTAARTHVRHGHVPEQILKAIRAVSADLVVMASHRPDDMRDMLVGSNAGKVVRQSPVSVLVVR